MGGTAFSPCNIDFLKYQETGVCICKISGKMTLFNKWNGGSLLPIMASVPSIDFFSMNRMLAERVTKILNKNLKYSKSVNPSVLLSSDPPPAASESENNANKRKRDVDVCNDGDCDEEVADKCGVIDIKRTILPFNSIYGGILKSRCAKTNGDTRKHRKKRKVVKNTKFWSVRGTSNAEKENIKRLDSNSEPTVNDDGKLDGDGDGSTGTYYSGLTDEEISYAKSLEKVDLNKRNQSEERIFQYFEKVNVNKEFYLLFTKAAQCHLLGEKDNRLLEAESILNDLIYSNNRVKKFNEALNLKRTECNTELAQLYMSQLRDENNNGTLNLKEGYDLIVRIMESSKNGYYCDFEPVLEKHIKFIRYYKEMCWLQWCVVCASDHMDNVLKKKPPHGVKNQRPLQNNHTHSQNKTGERHAKKVEQTNNFSNQQQCANIITYANNCLAVFYDMVGGYYYKGRVMIPPCKYVQEVAPLLNQLPDYGYLKKNYTNGTQQKNMAYCSISKQKLKLMCDFKFEDWV
jgi:hypothetical protein